MAIESRMENGALVFSVIGDIDHHAALSLRAQIDSEILEKSPHDVVLDLSGTDFMDSSGLGLILGRVRLCDERGIDLVVRNPSARVRKILDMAGAKKFLRYA